MFGHRVRLLAAVLTLAAAAAACGSSTTPHAGASSATTENTPRAQVLAAIGRVTTTSSYRFDMTVFTEGLAELLPGATGSNASFGFSGEYSGRQDAMEASATGLSSLVGVSASTIREIIFLRTGVLYIDVGSSPRGPWYELTGPAFSQALATLGSGVASIGDGDPAAYLQTISHAVVSARRIRASTVGGVATTVYAIGVNLRAVLDDDSRLESTVEQLVKSMTGAALTAADKEKVAQAVAKGFAAVPSTMTYDISIDRAGNVRRVTVWPPLGPLMSAVLTALDLDFEGDFFNLQQDFANVSESVTMDLSGFDSPIEVSAPPASEVRIPGVSNPSEPITF